MPPAVPDRIACHAVKDLRYALDPLRPLLEQPETEENWEKISRAIQTIAALAKGGAAELDTEYVKEIRNFSGMILNSMNSERTRLANVAVDLFSVITPPLGNRFEPLLTLFIPTLIKLLGRTNKVFVSRATAGLNAIISNCPHPRILVELRIMSTDKSASLRVIVAGAILQCLSEWDWSTPAFANKVGEIENFIRSTGTDSNVEVRKTARQAFELYTQLFPERVDDFLAPLTPVIKRYLDIKPKATSGPPRKPVAPVPAPRFPERRPAPAPTSTPATQEELDCLPTEPLPKKIRVGASRMGPSRAAAPELGLGPAPVVAQAHARVVSGPARVAVHSAREAVADPLKSGPMRAALPSTMAGAAPVARSVSTSGPSRMRVEQPLPPLVVPAPDPSSADPAASSYPPPAVGVSRRFRPNRAPMDPSQMPQRVAVPPPKPAPEPKKVDGPTRVNMGASAKASTSIAPVAPPARVVSAAKPERELKVSTSVPAPSSNSAEAPQPSTDKSVLVTVPMDSPEALEPVLTETVPPIVAAQSVASVPAPASAPVSRPASAVPFDSRPASVASTATSMAPSTSASVSAKPASSSAPTTVKPPLVSSKSAPISSKVSALIKRGNPNAPPPFVPKRTATTGGVGAATASQMARQREAIAAREKREAEEAAKKARLEAVQKKGGKGKEARDAHPKEKAEKPVDSAAPSKPSRTKRDDPQLAKTSSRDAPAAPRKAATLVRSKSRTELRKVDLKELEPELVAPVTIPLPGSSTPLAIREVPLPSSPPVEAVVTEAGIDAMALDGPSSGATGSDAVVTELASVTPAEQETEMETEQPEVVPETESTTGYSPIEDALMSDSADEEAEVMEETDEKMGDEGDQTIVITNQEIAQTPPRATSVSLIDQTPAATPAPVSVASAPSGFAFHPQLAQLMALPSQPTEEVDDFLVDLSSPPPKERPVEKEAANRFAFGDRGNTNNAYLNQFTHDMMMLSGL
ncbi:CLASP amino-terminal protein [Ceratobasidium sp. AG-Ba]|nr:CLASP amino-terminal protein [Ceratobasidium sp. AG-Ba]